MKLGERERWCTICLWSGKRVIAPFVASGPVVVVQLMAPPMALPVVRPHFVSHSGAVQWFDCGEHKDEPNGPVSKLEPIGPWLAACQGVGEPSAGEDDAES